MRGQRKREPNYTRMIGAIMVLLMVIGGSIYACAGKPKIKQSLILKPFS